MEICVYIRGVYTTNPDHTLSDFGEKIPVRRVNNKLRNHCAVSVNETVAKILAQFSYFQQNIWIVRLVKVSLERIMT